MTSGYLPVTIPITSGCSGRRGYSQASVYTRMQNVFLSLNVVIKGAVMMAVWSLTACNSTPLEQGMQPVSNHQGCKEKELLESKSLSQTAVHQKIEEDVHILSPTESNLTISTRPPHLPKGLVDVNSWTPFRTDRVSRLFGIARKQYVERTSILNKDYQAALQRGQNHADQIVDSITRVLKKNAHASHPYGQIKLIYDLERARSLSVDYVREAHSRYDKNALEMAQDFEKTMSHLAVAYSQDGSLDCLSYDPHFTEPFHVVFTSYPMTMSDKPLCKFKDLIDQHPTWKEFNVKKVKQNALTILSIPVSCIFEAHLKHAKFQVKMGEIFVEKAKLFQKNQKESTKIEKNS